MAKIKLKNIILYAYHGCMKEEREIGSDYIVNVVVDFDMSASSMSDTLSDTIDYVSLNKIIEKEMAVPANLLETVVERIISSIFKAHKTINSVSVEIDKINPPINGSLSSVSVKRKVNR